ncbi:hypothetical protein [Maridesulfovibrio hydrothermalis]|uniref:Uncharacterized protein n=1 Tax=Maridesulfovibrio hydrothermalis AM13 = DSM 14728 TaxID=1121451 RepID=L0R9A6_9BACT|nr:hypothetical protein [Maridesulfovibrio hydrothermalis]CCO22775.1 conserved protein of unknown function [Maridesulfovibrio hydrothermalis AM13 = DSM 14728]
MAGGKELTDRFLIALFKRGKAEFLPVTYLKGEGDKVLAKGQSDKLPQILSELTEKGILEEVNGEYKLIKDPFA